MPFIGVQPASALLTSADIQDGQITEAKIADDAVGNTKLDLSENYAFDGTISVDTIQGKTTAGTVAMPSGHVIQMINGRVSDDRATTASTSFTQLGDTLSITPKFSTSKIFMLATVSTELSGANSAFLDFGKTTGGSTTQNLSGVSGGIVTMYQQTWNHSSISFVDAPSTTNAIAYFVSVKVSAGTLYFNDNSANTYTHFTLMEIKQ